MPRNQTSHPKTKRLFDSDLLDRESGIESPPWQEFPETPTSIMPEPHPAVCGSLLTEATIGNPSSINSRPPRLEQLRLLLPTQAWCGPGRGKPGPFATATSWGTASIYPPIPENHGITLASMRRAELGGFLFIQRTQMWPMFAHWGAPRVRNKSAVSTAQPTGDSTGSECSSPMRTQDAPA